MSAVTSAAIFSLRVPESVAELVHQRLQRLAA